MSVNIPQPFRTDIHGSFGPVGPVTMTGIPDTYHLSIEKLPKLSIGLDPIEFGVAIRSIPNVRMHIPAEYTVGFSILGREVFGIRLCGEAQVITEPYSPNPCEICSTDAHVRKDEKIVQTQPAARLRTERP